MTVRDKLEDAFEQGRKAERDYLTRLLLAFEEDRSVRVPLEVLRLLNEDKYRADLETRYHIRPDQYVF